MASKIKVDTLETANGSGTIALSNQLSGMTTASLPTLTSAEMPAGSVVQVVGFNSVATFATTSSTFATTHLTQSITPLYANSKIFVQVFGSVYYTGAQDHGRGQIRKDGATITGMTDEDMLCFLAATTARGNTISSFVTTTSGSTNATTYAYYCKSGGGATFQLYRNSGISITEIKQ